MLTEEEIMESVEHLLYTVTYEILLTDVEPEVQVFVKAVNDKTLKATVYVPDEDIGKVVGRGGVLVSALRTILFAISRKVGKEIEIAIRPHPTRAELEKMASVQ